QQADHRDRRAHGVLRVMDYRTCSSPPPKPTFVAARQLGRARTLHARALKPVFRHQCSIESSGTEGLSGHRHHKRSKPRVRPLLKLAHACLRKAQLCPDLIKTQRRVSKQAVSKTHHLLFLRGQPGHEELEITAEKTGTIRSFPVRCGGVLELCVIDTIAES